MPTKFDFFSTAVFVVVVDFFFLAEVAVEVALLFVFLVELAVFFCFLVSGGGIIPFAISFFSCS